MHTSRHLTLSPPALLISIYVCFIAVGSLLLWLPISHYGSIGLVESLFTATSAVTVTGLVLVDTGSAFTGFGQLIIILLVQLGGLGLMAFAVLVFSALGISIGMPQRMILREDLNQTSLSNLMMLVKIIFSIALICEGIGALLLAVAFVPEYGARGVWHAIFHSISAFNNAGFALYPDSLSQWHNHPVVNTVVPLLFIVGGIGFIVIGDLYQSKRWSRLSLHSKLMLNGTAVLVIIGVASFALLEWHNPDTLGTLPLVEKLSVSWFQGLTPRTAGFSTIDIASMNDSTTLLFMLLMFVGGGSTSTAGGIKVTTLCILIVATITFLKRRETLHLFGRSLGVAEVMKVMALTTLSMMLIFVSIFCLSISHNTDFMDLAFEVVSAFGTVGLSRGMTTELNGIGLGVIMLIMFIGRIGPLALGFLLATRSVSRVQYPAGQVSLG